jgi:3-methyladenine DNA glycosylase AlkD
VTIQEQLFARQDSTYGDFQRKLMPTVSPQTVIGVRTPALRALAKELSGSAEAEAFLQELPHRYYEENNLHAYLLERIRDYPQAAAAVEEFLPYVDNWATCDSMKIRAFAKHKQELLSPIRRWLNSGRVYTVRFAIELLMNYYLDGDFTPEYPAMVAAVQSEEYYVNMMIAWYFATALAKQYEAVFPYIEQGKLNVWTHNKTIQKAVESYRITPEQKTILRALKI